MNEAFSVWVSVCTYKRPRQLEQLLASLERQRWPDAAQLLVVDNDPAGSAAAVVGEWRPRLGVPVSFALAAERGYASVRNRALDLVPHDAAVLFIDDDALVPSDWVGKIMMVAMEAPESLVRSRYSHMIALPTDLEALDQLERQILGHGSSLPAGTSGLLIPPHWRNDARFDPYFNSSGGEDTELLFRLRQLGAEERLAQTVAFEEQRVSVLPLARQLEIARWSGRLAVVVRQRNGARTWPLRVSALLDALRASGLAAAARLLGRIEAFNGFAALAAGRWAIVSAPLKCPSVFGTRVQ